MGFYNLATQAPVYRAATSGAVPSAPWMQQPSVSQYELFQQYYSPFSEGEYDKKAFSRATTEAINHGLNIPKDVKKSMEELAKNGDKWFDNEGNLLEGLSEKEARKATEHRRKVNQFYAKIKSKYVSPEQKRAQWASKNFIRNGFDTTAANQYAALTNYSDLASLWGGDVSGALKGGLYGAKASANEKAFYDKLTAPQKRAYLNQREQWVKSGLLKAAGGQDLSNGLQAVTDQDMLKYIQDNIQNWQNSFYGNNGYDDEYESSHPIYDQNTAYLYQLYGIPQTQASQAWVPTNTIRTSGFIIPQASSPTQKTNSKESTATHSPRRVTNDSKSFGKEINYETLRNNFVDGDVHSDDRYILNIGNKKYPAIVYNNRYVAVYYDKEWHPYSFSKNGYLVQATRGTSGKMYTKNLENTEGKLTDSWKIETPDVPGNIQKIKMNKFGGNINKFQEGGSWWSVPFFADENDRSENSTGEWGDYLPITSSWNSLSNAIDPSVKPSWEARINAVVDPVLDVASLVTLGAGTPVAEGIRGGFQGIAKGVRKLVGKGAVGAARVYGKTAQKAVKKVVDKKAKQLALAEERKNVAKTSQKISRRQRAMRTASETTALRTAHETGQHFTGRTSAPPSVQAAPADATRVAQRDTVIWRRQGGTLDYKHYFDFFNNKFN